MAEEEKFDVIVIGAGPAGVAAAITAQRQGLETVLLERGNYPGSKNLFGGILFTPELAQLIPDFFDKAPLERFMARRRFSYLSEDSEIALDFWSKKYIEKPFNHSFTVLRSEFDRWFAEEAEKAGVQLLTGVVVEDVIWQDDHVVGIKARGEKEGEYDELFASVVICAEGVNSLIAEKAKLRKDKSKMGHENRTVAVKEVIQLSEEVVNERFHIKDREGVSIVYLGDAVKNLLGTGFLYTYKNSLSIGLGCEMKDLIDHKMAPYDLLDHFKEHPAVSPLIKGGEVVEYSTHMIPEDTFDRLPSLYTHGLMLVGDCAGLVNSSIFQEATNMAIASGIFAGETAVHAKKENDFSSKTLAFYRKKLDNSFVLKDMYHYRNFLSLLRERRRLVNDYPEMMLDFIINYFVVDGRPKQDIKKELFKNARKKIRLPQLIMDLIKARRMI